MKTKNTKGPGAPRGNGNASKGGISGCGRIVVDAGALKARCVRLAGGRGQRLTDFVREALEEKLAREEAD